jgi:hypothetical protein
LQAAASIAKATKNIKFQQGQNARTLLRVTNLEKSLKKNIDKTNELSNKLKPKRQRKNIRGDRTTESTANSKPQQTLQKMNIKHQKTKMLTSNEEAI